MATAGYLIARAAEQPPVLALTIAIVTVRFFALCRPLARYGERLASHDLALRGLGRIRARSSPASSRSRPPASRATAGRPAEPMVAESSRSKASTCAGCSRRSSRSVPRLSSSA